MNLQDLKIGFVGTGQMATALAKGFVEDLISSSQIFGVDPIESSRDSFKAKIGDCNVSEDSATIIDVDILFLAVKPQVMASMLTKLAPSLPSGQLVVSIAAGLSISTLESWLPVGTRLIRVMPNTPCLVGQGACGVSRGSAATEQDEDLICTLLNSISLVERVDEKLLDAVTGLSGSGPAYVFQMIEALSDGGVKVGLPRATATRLAAQTLLGAAEMVLKTGKHPGELKDNVTSPGGTTIAAIHAMEQAGVRAALMDAVEASTNRSRELG